MTEDESASPGSAPAGPVRRWSHAFIAAVQFLTRLPVPGDATQSAAAALDDLRRSVVFFPLVGALIGAVTALVLAGAAQGVAWPVAVLIALAAEAVLTGALHEDAVADFCDAFGCGRTREDTLRILKDSRIGSFGALGLGFAVALRAAALISMTDIWQAALVLIAAGGIARLVALIVMAWVPPAGDRAGLATAVGGAAGPWDVAAGALLISPLLAGALWLKPLGAMGIVAAVALFIVGLRRLLLRRLGGVTGDGLGFAAYGGLLITTIGLAG